MKRQQKYSERSERGTKGARGRDFGFHAELMKDYSKLQPASTRTSVGFVYKGRYHVVEGFFVEGDTIVFGDTARNLGELDEDEAA